MRLWRDVRTDLRLKAEWCYDTPSGFGSLLRVLCTDSTMAMVVYRLMQWARRHRLGPLEMVFNRINGIFSGCIIGRGAEFGEGFVLIHAGGVVINGAVRGGNRIYVEHQVTIGAERGRSPVLGNDIFIGAGAKIIGAVTIGDGARIGANAVVVKDVPAWSTVVGVPAKVVRRRDPEDGELAPSPRTTEEPDRAPHLRGERLNGLGDDVELSR